MLIQTKNRRVATTGFLWQRKEFLQSDGLPPKLNLLFVEPTPVVSGDKKNLTDQGRNERQQRKLDISTINDGPLLRNFIYWIGWWLQQKFSLPLPEIVTKERTIISEPVCIIVYILWYNHYIRTIFLYQKWSWNAWGYANLIWINPLDISGHHSAAIAKLLGCMPHLCLTLIGWQRLVHHRKAKKSIGSFRLGFQ